MVQRTILTMQAPCVAPGGAGASAGSGIARAQEVVENPVHKSRSSAVRRRCLHFCGTQ